MFFSNKKSGKVTLILDVQSSIVRSSLVFSVSGAIPRVLFTSSKSISYHDALESRRLIKATTRITKEAIEESHRYLKSLRESDRSIPREIHEAHYVLSSPWILSHAKKTDTQFDEEKIITSDLVLDIVHREREKMISEARISNKSTEVEEKIFGVELNGYVLSNWEGKTATSLSVSFVTSICGIKMRDRFLSLARSYVNRHRIYFHSSLLMQHIGLGELYPEKETYAIVHIHGEVTDIVAVKNRSCTYFGTFPIGSQTMVRAFSEATGMESQTAASALSMHVNGVIDHKLDPSYKAVENVNRQWIEHFCKLMEKSSLPITGGFTMIVSALERKNTYVELLRVAYPKAKVETLEIADVSAHVDQSQTKNQLIMLALYTIAVQKLYP